MMENEDFLHLSVSQRGVIYIHFASLTLFSGLSKWEDIERLSFLPKLAELKAKGIPLLQSFTTDERRSLLLAQ